MEPVKLREQLLAQARRDFTAFYAAATPRDAALFEALVLACANLTVSMNAPRKHLPAFLRTQLERATNANEDFYTELRNEVQACSTFVMLSDVEQSRIARVLFDVKPPMVGEE